MPTFYSPSGNAEIWKSKPDGYFTEAEWLAANPILESEPLPEPEPPTFEATQAAKLVEILAGANRAYQKVTARYSIPEQQSWDIQKTQAEALLAAPEADAPEVRALAANRNIPVAIFAQRILDNSAHASTASLAIILQQQSYEDKLEAAQTVEAVEAIQVKYNLPMEVN